MPQFPKGSDNKLFYGADYNPEQWDRDVWQEDVRLMKEAGVNVVSIGIFSWALIERSDNVWDFGWLDEVCDLMHKNGISIDMGTATASPPPWLTIAHPEILPIAKDGSVMGPGSRNHYRITSPVFRKYALRLVTKMAERYGSHPGLIAWHVNNELGTHDFSDDAAAAFRIWLKKRYEHIDKLNGAWGTAFWSQRYNDFDEILPPRAAQTFINPTQQLDWARYSSDALSNWLDDETAILKKISPNIPVTTNYMLAGQTKGMDVANWHVDFVSNDHYRFPSRELDEDELSLSASLTSAVAGGHPWWLMEHSTSSVNWQSVNPRKKKGQLIRDSLTHVAHGADAVCFFQWRQSRVGAEKYHSSMIPHAGPESKIFRDVVQLGQDLKTLAEIKGSRKKLASVAIVWDWESWVACEMDGHPSTLVDYFREIREWFVSFMDLGIRVDVITAQADLSPYKLVVAPILYLVQDSVQSSITSFVENGGHFVTTYFSGIVDGNDHVRLGGYPGAFSDLLGIRIEEWAPLLADETVVLDDGSVGTIWTDYIDLKSKDVHVLRKYQSGELRGKPAVTSKSHGTGSATYVSTRLNLKGLESLLPELLEKSGVKSSIPKSIRSTMEHVVRTDGKREWDFWINRTEEEVDITEVGGKLILKSGGASEGRLAGRSIAVFRRDL
jgi:beta-galactosidase